MGSDRSRRSVPRGLIALRRTGLEVSIRRIHCVSIDLPDGRRALLEGQQKGETKWLHRSQHRAALVVPTYGTNEREKLLAKPADLPTTLSAGTTTRVGGRGMRD